MNQTLYSVTGKQGSGKTAFLMSLVEKAAIREIAVGGFLQKRVNVQDGLAMAYDLTRARTGECVRVATRQSDRKFVFESQAFRTALAWVNEDMLAAKLIVIDELGFIESQGEGHAAVLPLILNSSPQPIVCFSLRKDRAEEWYEKLLIPQSQRLDLDADECNREVFMQRILEAATFHPPYPPRKQGGKIMNRKQRESHA
jgi:nucleoside-triphosphatase THEP1